MEEILKLIRSQRMLLTGIVLGVLVIPKTTLSAIELQISKQWP
jgi:hypothetical protein